MDKTGLYVINKAKTTDALNPKYPSVTWNKHALANDDCAAISTTDEKDSLGIRAVDNKLIFNGDVIAMSTDAMELKPEGNNIDGGDSAISNRNECIDITLENYNKLLLGIDVSGYSDFNREAIYNIVDEVNSDPSYRVSYNDIDTINKLIYHGQDGQLKENNTIDGLPEHDVDKIATFINTDCPVLSIHPIDYIASPGERIIIEFHVDSKDAYFLNENQIGDTFTVIVKDAFGRTVGKRTTYAGISSIRTLPFLNEEGNNFLEGNTWFSIQAINKDGVESATTFIEIKFHTENVRTYEMTLADLTSKGIVLNNDDPIVGYTNKMKLEAFFAEKKSQNYNKVVLYNSGNDTYYIDLHKNLSGDDNNINLGGVTYYLAKIETVNGERQITYQEFEEGDTVTVNGQPITVDEPPLEWIRRDALKLHRDPNDKIYVIWNETSRFFDDTKHVYDQSTFGKKYGFKVLSTLRKSYLDSNAAHIDPDLEDGYRYVVDNNAEYYNLVFPNEFTLDLNGATLKAISPVDLSYGCLASLRHNDDTTITNGKIIGHYAECDMVGVYLNVGARIDYPRTESPFHATRLEHISTSQIIDCKFCSFDNVDISQAIGYEGSIGYESEGVYPPNGLVSNYGDGARTNSEFITMGYINHSGNLCNPYDNSEYSGETIKVDSSDYANNKAREITPVSTNNFIRINMRYDYTNNAGELVPVDPRYVQGERVYFLLVSPKQTFSAGKKKEIFVSFYSSNNNNSFICTIKSAWHRIVRIPENANYIKITAYGISELENNQRVVAKYINGNTVKGLSFEMYQVKPTYGRGPNVYKNCNFHDTRTIALYPSVRASYFINNTYNRIAVEPGSWWELTSYLSDFEEGGLSIDYINIQDCTVINNGKVVLNMNYGQNLNIINTGLIGYKELGGIQNGYIKGCDIKVLSQRRNNRHNYKYVYFDDCTIHDHLYLSDDSDTSTGRISQTFTAFGYTVRKNRHDDPIDLRMPLRNTLAAGNDLTKDELQKKFYNTKIKNDIYP